MKSRITKKFQLLKTKEEKALITYITAGDPNVECTYQLVLEMEKVGVDIIELGIPYSDPLADGPVIQRASHRALEAGTNIDAVFNLVKKLRESTEIPLVLLVYFNCIFQYGITKFLESCKNSGIDGVIIPDLPLEERKDMQKEMVNYPVDLIPLVAPTSEDRIKEIVKDAEGFIYCVSSLGVTGTREDLQVDFKKFMNKVKSYTDIPLAVGFGISSPKMVQKVNRFCDGIIVGSAIVEKIEEGIKENKVIDKVKVFVKKLDEAKNIT